jgi:glycogen debranching enzyme
MFLHHQLVSSKTHFSYHLATPTVDKTYHHQHFWTKLVFSLIFLFMMKLWRSLLLHTYCWCKTSTWENQLNYINTCMLFDYFLTCFKFHILFFIETRTVCRTVTLPPIVFFAKQRITRFKISGYILDNITLLKIFN